MAKDIQVQIKAEDHASAAVSQVKKAMDGLKDKTVNIKVGSAGSAGITGAMSAMQGQMENVQSASSGLVASLVSVKAAMTALATGAIASAGVYMVKLAGDFQNVQVALTNMLGSAEKAQSLIADLQQFAATTPFEFQGLAKASQKLLAFGFTAEQLIPTLTAVGDAAAGLGVGAEGVDRITLALGQMAAKGRVQSDEMLQLTEAGIPAWKMLADTIGTDIPTAMDKVTKGQVDAQTGLNALVSGMESRFAGLMDQQSKTISGSWSNLMDGMEQSATQVGLRISDAFNLPDLFTNIGNQLQAFARDVESSGVADALANLIPPGLAMGITTVAGALTGALIPAAIAAVPALIDLAVAAAAALIPLAPYIAIGAAVGAAIYAILEPAEAFTTLLELTGTSASDASAQLVYVQGVTDNFMQSIYSAVDAAKDWITANFDLSGSFPELSSAIDATQGAFDRLGNNIANAIQQVGWLKSAIDALNDNAYGAKFLHQGAGATFGASVPVLGSYGESGGPAYGATVALDKITSKASRPDYSQFGFGSGGAGKAAKGSSGKSAAERAAEALQRKIDSMAEKVAESINTYQAKIMDETGTAYEKGMANLQADIDKTQDEIKKASALGIDTTELQSKLDQYSQAIKDKLVKAWKEANEDIKQDTDLTWAQINDSAASAAKVQYQIDLTKLNREKETKLKEIALTKDSVEAQAELQAWYTAKATALAKTLETALAKEPKTWRSAWRTAMQNVLDDMGSIGSQMMTAMQGVAQSMSDGFTDFFTDILTLDFDSIGDAFSDMLKNMLKSIAQFLSNKLVTQLFNTLLGSTNIGSGITATSDGSGGYTLPTVTVSGARASGGPVSAGRAYLVGENGPELYIPSSNGTVANRVSGSGDSQQTVVTVTVNNTTDQKMQATQKTSTDGTGRQLKEIIISTVGQSLYTNEGGIRDMVAGVRGG
jgi:tape measure domain-containing protein